MMDNDTAGDGPAGIESPPGPGLRASLEAILLVVDEPVAEVMLAQVLERPREEIALEIRELAASYDAEGRGFDLREVAGGWRFYTREECAPVVERFVRDGQEVRLTQAALETLAVVAYRQPVSRARVSAVRGVNCDGVMRTLTLRGLVEEAGTEYETGAILYRTTGYFLERLGLAGLEDLPDLAPFLPDHVEDADEEAAGPAGRLGGTADTGSEGVRVGGHAGDNGGTADADGTEGARGPEGVDAEDTVDAVDGNDTVDAVDTDGADGTMDAEDTEDAGDEHAGP